MLVRCGAAGCVIACATFLLAPLAAAGRELHSPLPVSPYALLCFSAVAFLAGDAMLVIGKLRPRDRRTRRRKASSSDGTGAPAHPSTSVDDLVGMLDDTLRFARPVPAAGPLEPIDVADLLRTMAAQSDSQRLKVAAGSQPIHTLGSRPAVGRAFEILIVNALAHGTQAVVSSDHGTSALVVHVDDDGPGIARSEREQVFEWRYYMSTPPSQQTGCGAELVIARQIVRAHGGDITVGPSPLGGARFTARMPLIAEHEFELAAAS